MAQVSRFLIAVAGFSAAHLLCAALFPRLPALPHGLSPLASYVLLVGTSAAALHPFINLRTTWYYLLILAPTFVELAALAGLGPSSPWIHLLLNLAILAYAYCLGKLFAKGIRRDGLLLSILFLLSATDAISVFGGPAKAIYYSRYGKCFVLNWPAPGLDGVRYVLGFGDLFLYTLLLAWCMRNGLPVTRTVRALLATFAVVGTASWASGAILPTVPFLCLSFFGAHVDRFRAARLSPADRRLLAFGVVTLAAAAIVFQQRIG